MANDTLDLFEWARKAEQRAKHAANMRLRRSQDREGMRLRARQRRLANIANARVKEAAKARKGRANRKIMETPKQADERRLKARERYRQWRAANPEKALAGERRRDSRRPPRTEWRKRYEIKHRDHINRKMRIYRLGHPDQVRAYAQKSWQLRKGKLTINQRLAKALRTRLNMAIRNGQKAGSAIRDLGCSIDEFKDYIARMFRDGMSWDNWGRRGWHLDHIEPVSLFDLTDHAQLERAFHFSNYQPLWWQENLSKGARPVGLPSNQGASPR